MFAPEAAVADSQVQVERTRIAATEEMPPGDSLFSSMDVSSPLESGDVRRHIRARRMAAEDVEDGLRGESVHRGASRMLQRERQFAQEAADSYRFLGEEQWPGGVIWDHPHRSG